MKEITNHILTGIAFVFAMFVLAYILVGLTACTKTEVKYVDRPFEVKVAVPQKCEFKLPPKPVIKTNNLQNTIASAGLMIEDSVTLRKELKTIPCLIIIDGREILLDFYDSNTTLESIQEENLSVELK